MRYFLHLRDGTDEMLDPDGVETPAEAVAAEALAATRGCMAGDVQDGVLDLRYRSDVEDASGSLVHSLGFRRALDIIYESNRVAPAPVI